MVEIEGYAALFMRRNTFNDIITDSAFDSVVERFNAGDRSVRLVSNYTVGAVIGHITALKKDHKGLFIEGVISDLITIKEYRERKFKGFSLVYKVRDFEFDEEGRVLKDIDLLAINLAKNPPEHNARIFERVLQE